MVELRLSFAYGDETIMAAFSQLVRETGLRLSQVKGMVCRSRVLSFYTSIILAGGGYLCSFSSGLYLYFDEASLRGATFLPFSRTERQY